MLVGHIAGQFSSPFLPRSSSVPPHPAEEVLVIVIIGVVIVIIVVVIIIVIIIISITVLIAITTFIP